MKSGNIGNAVEAAKILYSSDEANVNPTTIQRLLKTRFNYKKKELHHTNITLLDEKVSAV